VSPKQHIAPGARVVRRLAAGAAVALSALAALAPGAANAGTYQMYNCHVAGHETGNQGPWTQSTAYGTPGMTFWSACGGAGGVDGYVFGPYASGAIGANSRVNLTLTKDNSNISITGMKLWWRGMTGIASGYANNPITATVWKDGTKLAEWSGGQTANYFATPFEMNPSQQVTLSLACAPSGPCQPSWAFPLEVSGAETTLVENVLPGAAITGGMLTAGGAQSGTKTVTVEGTDPDSGVRKLEVLLDAVVVASNDYKRDWTKPLSEQQAGTCAFDSWRACDATRTVSLNVDTRDLADGAYALSARVTDAAGNVRTVQAGQPVVIDNVVDPAAPAPVQPTGTTGPAGSNGSNGGPGPIGANGRDGAVLTINGVNGSPNATVRATFASTRRGIITSAYGKKVLVTGQLTGPNGQPITGARVAVMQQDKMVGAKMVPAGEVVTDKDGKFRYVTTAQRSRTVRFGYRAHLQDVDFAQTTDISLGVVAKVAFKTNRKSLRNGQTVRFSGSVAGAPANARKVVELQVKKPSGWMTFRSTRLRNGRFSEPYRFTATRGRQTYVFRARVRQEAGFPFLTGVSKSAKVTVRG
jgi:hypothetical protein